MNHKSESVFKLIFGEEALPDNRAILSADIKNLTAKCESLNKDLADSKYVDNFYKNNNNLLYLFLVKLLSWPW